MPSAFQNNAQVKTQLLEKLDRHIADGTLKSGATSWDGVSGSPLGVSIEGTDAQAYAECYQYPVALAALLDPLSSAIENDEDRLNFIRSWVDVVQPGDDLASAPVSILTKFLAAAEPSWPELVSRIIALQNEDLAGHRSRSEWSALRDDIAEVQKDQKHGLERFHAQLCEAASWPVTSSQSVLTEVARIWIGIGGGPTPGWDFEVARALHFTIEGILIYASSRGEKLTLDEAKEILRARSPALVGKGDEMLAAQDKVQRDHVARAAAFVLESLKEPMLSEISAAVPGT